MKSFVNGVILLIFAGMPIYSSSLYANSAGGSGIQVYDPATGNLINTIVPAHVSNGRGVVTVGSTLYYTEADQNSVFAYNLQANADMGAVFSVSGASGLATIAYDGTNLFLGDYTGTNHVYEYSLSGNLLKTLSLANCSGYCDGLEYANGFLFSNRTDGGYGNPSSYDEYDLNGNLVKAGFITTNYGASGIAYDGTDYYVSNIYAGLVDKFDGNGTYVSTLTLQHPTDLVEDLSFDYASRADTGTPEPASYLLLGMGLVAGALVRKIRKA